MAPPDGLPRDGFPIALTAGFDGFKTNGARFQRIVNGGPAIPTMSAARRRVADYQPGCGFGHRRAATLAQCTGEVQC